MVQNAAVMNLKNKMLSANNENAPEKKSKYEIIQDLIEENVKNFAKALPAHMNAERLARITLTAIRKNPKLASCTPQSLLGAVLQASQLGLEPDIEGQAYLLPYKNTKRDKSGKKIYVDEVQFQIGYKGYIELYYRHKFAGTVDVHAVHENDLFDYCYGTQPYLKHRPADDNRGEIKHFYAIAQLTNGCCLFKVMSKKSCIEHGQKHSKAFKTKEWDESIRSYVSIENPCFDANSSWATDEDAMCKKTVLLQLSKLLPKSVELQKAFAMDNTTKSNISADMFDVPDETNWEEDVAELPPAKVGEG